MIFIRQKHTVITNKLISAARETHTVATHMIVGIKIQTTLVSTRFIRTGISPNCRTPLTKLIDA